MPRLLHSQVYLTIMWRRSLQFATKKDLKKFRFARRHSNPQGLYKGPCTATQFFLQTFFWELRSLSHQKSFSRGQLGNQSETIGMQFSILTTFRFNGLSSLVIENHNNFKYRVTRDLLFFHCKLSVYICFKSWKSIVIALIVGKVKEPGIKRNMKRSMDLTEHLPENFINYIGNGSDHSFSYFASTSYWEETLYFKNRKEILNLWPLRYDRSGR